MKSRMEYLERQMKYMLDGCFSWARLSKEERAWYTNKGITRRAYIQKYSRNNRRMDRWIYYVKKHGFFINGKRIRKSESHKIKE